MFLPMLMRFHLEKESEAVRPVLLTTGSAARLQSTDQSPTGKVSCQRFVEVSLPAMRNFS